MTVCVSACAHVYEFACVSVCVFVCQHVLLYMFTCDHMHVICTCTCMYNISIHEVYLSSHTQFNDYLFSLSLNTLTGTPILPPGSTRPPTLPPGVTKSPTDPILGGDETTTDDDDSSLSLRINVILLSFSCSSRLLSYWRECAHDRSIGPLALIHHTYACTYCVHIN